MNSAATPSSPSANPTNRRSRFERSSRMTIATDTKMFIKACQEGDIQAVVLQIKRGIDVNGTDDNAQSAPLHWAAQSGHADIVQTLLSNNADVDQVNKGGLTALHYAADKGHAKVVTLLIQKGASVNMKEFKDNWAPLTYAASKGHHDVVTLLVESGADVNTTESDGWSPLHFACSEGREEIVNTLIEYNSDVHCAAKDGLTALHISSEFGYDNLVRTLIKHKAKVNTYNQEGYTPLHKAAEYGHFDIVKILYENEGDLNALTTAGCTALHFASEHNHVDIVRFVLENRAHINKFTYTEGLTALHNACEHGNTDVVTLLITYRALINAESLTGWTPLMYAAEKGNFEIVNFLLANSADVHMQNKAGCTALHRAALNGHIDVMRYLLIRKANVHIADNEGSTPLHYAAIAGHEESVRYLIDNEAIVNIRNALGLTPLHNAASNGHNKAVATLLELNADVNFECHKGEKPFHKALINNKMTTLKLLIKPVAGVIDNKDMVSFYTLMAKKHEFAQNIYDGFILPIEKVTPTNSKSTDRSKWQGYKYKLTEDEYVVRSAEDIEISELNEAGSQGTKIEKYWYVELQEKTRADFFSKYYYENIKDGVETGFTCFDVDMPYLSSPSFIFLVLMVDKYANTNIFELEPIKVAIQNAWESYGYPHHLVQLSLYITLLVVTSVNNYTFNSYSSDDMSLYDNRVALGLTCATLFMNSIFSVQEILELYNHFFEYIQNTIKIIDLITFALIYSGSYFRLIDGVETVSSTNCMSVATVLLYIKFTYYLRPFKATGHLIGMIEAIVWKIRYFILLLAMLLFGFSQGLYLLSFEDISGDFGRPGVAYIHAFSYMISGTPQAAFPPPGTLPQQAALATFLVAMLCFVSTIVLMNLLISMMSYFYEKIEADAENEWRRKLCQIMCDQFHFNTPKVKRFLHYIKRDLDIERDQKKSKESIKSKLEKVYDYQQKLESKQETLSKELTTQMKTRMDASERSLLRRVEDLELKFASKFDNIATLLEILVECNQRLIERTHESASASEVTSDAGDDDISPNRTRPNSSLRSKSGIFKALKAEDDIEEGDEEGEEDEVEEDAEGTADGEKGGNEQDPLKLLGGELSDGGESYDEDEDDEL